MEKTKEEIVKNIISITNGRIEDLKKLKGMGVMPDDKIDYLINSYKESIENGNKILGG